MWWAPILASFIGGLMAASAAIAGVYITQRRQAGLDVLRDQRALRDARRERLSKLLQATVHASFTANRVASEFKWNFAGESVEDRDARLQRMIDDATATLNETRVALLLTPGGARYVDLLDEIFKLMREYKASLDQYYENKRSIRIIDVGIPQERMKGKIEELVALAQTQLAALEEPIGPLRSVSKQGVQTDP